MPYFPCDMPGMDEAAIWQAMGGDEGCRRLVHEFYTRVQLDDLIGPMYPPDDWAGAERRLYLFLAMRIGGREDYIAERGHPRLRMRHVPFSIGVAERDRWLQLMREAMSAAEMPAAAAEPLDEFFVGVADFMRNRPA